MRKNIVPGNWKMNTTLQEGVKLATEVNDALKSRTPNCDVIICVPFTHLASVKAVIDDSKLGLGAENCADKAKGAFTGEVSGAMVASTGAKYVILGHSERSTTTRLLKSSKKKWLWLLKTALLLSSASARCSKREKTAHTSTL